MQAEAEVQGGRQSERAAQAAGKPSGGGLEQWPAAGGLSLHGDNSSRQRQSAGRVR